MLMLNVTAKVEYTYTLTDDEENAVRKIIRENPDEFEYVREKDKIALAYEKVRNNDETGICKLYEDERTVESDFRTEKFDYSEYNEMSAEEWLENDEEANND